MNYFNKKYYVLSTRIARLIKNASINRRPPTGREHWIWWEPTQRWRNPDNWEEEIDHDPKWDEEDEPERDLISQPEETVYSHYGISEDFSSYSYDRSRREMLNYGKRVENNSFLC